MEIYIARQPVFDNDKNLYGYELLYRQRRINYYEGSNENQSTLTLISNAFGIGFNSIQIISIYYVSKLPIESIDQAVILTGTKGMIRLISLLLFRDVRNRVNEELIKTSSLVRVKLRALKWLYSDFEGIGPLCLSIYKI